jgi:hypothetical protein
MIIAAKEGKNNGGEPTQNGEGTEFSMEQICNKIKKNGKIMVSSLPQWCFFSCIRCVQDIP